MKNEGFLEKERPQLMSENIPFSRSHFTCYVEFFFFIKSHFLRKSDKIRQGQEVMSSNLLHFHIFCSKPCQQTPVKIFFENFFRFRRNWTPKIGLFSPIFNGQNEKATLEVDIGLIRMIKKLIFPILIIWVEFYGKS